MRLPDCCGGSLVLFILSFEGSEAEGGRPAPFAGALPPFSVCPCSAYNPPGLGCGRVPVVILSEAKNLSCSEAKD